MNLVRSKVFKPHLFLVLLLFVTHLNFGQSESSSRMALIIGVKNYQHIPKLQNSLNDAQDIAATLKAKGFQVVELYDPQTKRQMQDAIIKYFNLLQGDHNASGLVFYSGHGMQVDGANYLIPTLANPLIKADLDDQCLNMDYVMRAIEQAGNPLNIFILDACRNNPFRGFYRSGEQGLSMVSTPKGSYIVYATKPGSVASDGTGRNGLFTSKLLKYINAAGLNIEQVFKKVAADVSKESMDAQRPWIASDYTGDFYFTAATTDARKEKTVSLKDNVMPEENTNALNAKAVADETQKTPDVIVEEMKLADNGGLEEIYNIVEESASPVGGMAAFYKYFDANMKYPAQARRMGIEGKVFVQFVINTDGSISNIKVVRGLAPSCDEEAVRVVEASPAWNPGKMRGKAVRQSYTMALTFKLK